MLKELVQFKPTETLIPNTGIQFLDLGLKASVLQDKKVKRDFWPEIHSANSELAKEMFTLHVVQNVVDEAGGHDAYMTLVAPGEKPREPDDVEQVYAVNAARALEIYEGQWLPAPFFRKRESGSNLSAFDAGPTDWARFFITRLEEPDGDGNTHRVTFALDTLLPTRRDGAPYAAPDPSDAKDGSVFMLVTDPLLNRGYVGSGWARQWLREAFLVFRNKGRSGRRLVTAEDLHNPEGESKLGEYWGAYQVLLDAIAAACPPPALRFVDTIEAIKVDSRNKVDVDLMIDVGNNRTCGMYVEHHANRERVDITAAQRVEVRDLTRPAHVYAEPIQSTIEFFPPSFGFDSLARASQRPRRPAFFWPSPVRIGPEAARLATFSDGTEGVTGMSSPKRYLWDGRARQQPWANNPGAPRASGESTPAIKGHFTALLTEDGSLVRKGAQVGVAPLYSRASMYTLMLAEFLLHVIGQMNSIASRKRRDNVDHPRCLRRLVLTLPSATPVAEQRALRQLAQSALELVWRSMGWPTRKDIAEGKVSPADRIFEQPSIKLDWDEASCTHLVYLYNEVNVRFRGSPGELFEFMGRGRKGETGPAMRIASIDIGGGTTDLMIIQHEAEEDYIINPKQLFREGFRQAGDDIVKTVAELCVVPALRNALEASGVSKASALLAQLFGGDRDDVATPQRTLRALFVNQIVTPAAFSLLSRYEAVDPRRLPEPQTLLLGDLLPADKPVSLVVREYLQKEARNRGGGAFDVLQTPVVFDPRDMGDAIASVIRPMIENLCDVVRAYDCDVLLLSGRPSRLPLFRDLVVANAPCPIEQVVTLHDYEVGPWYPFRSLDNHITDPKTTAVVGAMLCQTCEGGAEGFFMRSSRLKMRSTARFIGPLDDDRIREKRVAQRDLDPDDPKLTKDHQRFDVTMSANFFLGFRQLPIERWPASPLLYVCFRNGDEAARHVNVPVKLTFERQEPREAPRERDEKAAEQAAADFFMESFKIEAAIDASGNDVIHHIQSRMQTLRIDREGGGGYWLDTGILDTKRSEQVG